MKQVTVGVIGLGLMGDRHARVFSQLPGVRLTAVADVRGERVESVAQATGTQAYTDYRDLLNRSDLDAVSICLPDSMHLEAVLAAAAAKKHILLEKPIATRGLYQRTGCPPHPMYPLTKLLWLRGHQPDLWGSTPRWGRSRWTIPSLRAQAF